MDGKGQEKRRVLGSLPGDPTREGVDMGIVLAFIYFSLATPFLVWALFRYTDMKDHEAYYEIVDGSIKELQAEIRALKEQSEEAANELSKIKLKAGFSGKEKNYL